MADRLLEQKPNVPVLEVRNVSKRFGHVQALSNVSLEVHRGDVVGLLGDNGAGKSTLIKIISGNYQCDEGDVRLEGKKVSFTCPAEARAAGIETVYQQSPICANASVYENFFIGREPVKSFLGVKTLDEQKMQVDTRKILSDIGTSLPSIDVEMGLLSGGQRQAILLGRFFHWGGKIALLDEPFAALGVAESRNALKLIQEVSKRGLPMILITHNIEYAFQVINRFVILRHGEVVGAGRADQVSMQDVVATITGAIQLAE